MLDELAEKPIIEKLHYVIPAGDGLRWEIDEFLGVNQGLVVAEIELPSEVIRIMVPNTFISISHALFFEYIKFFPQHKIRVITPVSTEEFRKGSADIVAVTGNVTLPDSVLIPRGRMIFVPVAAPSFIEKYGLLDHPDRLAEVPVGHTFGGDKFSYTPFNGFTRKKEFCRPQLRQQIEWSSTNLLFESVLAGEWRM